MIRRELGLFLLVGVLTVLIDYLVYSTLSWWQAPSIGLAKGVGFIAGTLFAYLANRFWTFGHKSHVRGSLLRFALLYAVTLFANVTLNELVLGGLFDFQGSVPIAFVIATGVSATMNFIGMKLFVFKTALPPKKI